MKTSEKIWKIKLKNSLDKEKNFKLSEIQQDGDLGDLEFLKQKTKEIKFWKITDLRTPHLVLSTTVKRKSPY